MATGDLHTKFCEDRSRSSRYMLANRQTDTDRQADHNTPLPFRGGVIKNIRASPLYQTAVSSKISTLYILQFLHICMERTTSLSIQPDIKTGSLDAPRTPASDEHRVLGMHQYQHLLSCNNWMSLAGLD